jgi:hypothetical protein
MLEESLSFPWYRTWINALIQPSVTTFEKIAAEPDAANGSLSARLRALVWVLLSSSVGFLVYYILERKLLKGYFTPVAFGPLTELDYYTPRIHFGGALLAAALALSYITLSTFVMHQTARVFKKEAVYTQLICTTTAYYAPWLFISYMALLFGIIPALVVYVWMLVLQVLVVRAVYKFQVGQAIIVGGLVNGAAIAGLIVSWMAIASTML